MEVDHVHSVIWVPVPSGGVKSQNMRSSVISSQVRVAGAVSSTSTLSLALHVEIE